MGGTFEAFVGALYLDGGMKAAETFCSVVLLPNANPAMGTYQGFDPKTRLRMLCTKNAKNPAKSAPKYWYRASFTFFFD